MRDNLPFPHSSVKTEQKSEDFEKSGLLLIWKFGVQYHVPTQISPILEMRVKHGRYPKALF